MPTKPAMMFSIASKRKSCFIPLKVYPAAGNLKCAWKCRPIMPIRMFAASRAG